MTHDEKIVEAVATAEVRYDGYEDLLCLSRTMRERYLDRARAAITAYQAEAWQPLVKPLEWQATRSGYVWVALAAVGRYFIEERHSDFRWNVESWPGQWTADTLDEAKAAAQADYETRIRSSLLPNPPASP